MKPMKLLRWLTMVPLLLTETTRGATSLLPGVTYHESRQKLTGKLAFLVSWDAKLETNSTASAAIYEFDLSEKKLTKVTDAPKGLFHVSGRGEVFWVVFRPGNWYQTADSNVFVYSSSIDGGRIIHLESEPRQTVAVRDHVFFTFETTDTKRNKLVTKLLDYDISRDEKREIRLSETSKWQYEDYDKIHIPRGQTNVLHFYFKGYGNRLEGGKDYRAGYYSLNVSTAEIRWFAELLDDRDDEGYTFRTADDRYVFFEGADAPVRGFKLVSSPWNFRESKNRDPRGEKVNVLKEFSRRSIQGGNAYLLSQVSPDGRYVLVRLQEPSLPKSAAQPGWMNTYFLLDVSDGESNVLLKDEVEHITNGSMSAIRWIQ